MNLSFFTKSSVSPSVKKAYVHWVFKGSNPTTYSILLSPSVRHSMSFDHPDNLQPVPRVFGPLAPYFP
jgi:hypothetical protein